MKKKQTAALLMAVMLAFAGAACGNSGGSESTDSESAGNETAGAETDSKDAGDIDEIGRASCRERV